MLYNMICIAKHTRAIISSLLLIQLNTYFFLNNFIYLFIFGYLRFLLLPVFSLVIVSGGGLLSSCGAWASHCSGFSSCRA